MICNTKRCDDEYPFFPHNNRKKNGVKFEALVLFVLLVILKEEAQATFFVPYFQNGHFIIIIILHFNPSFRHHFSFQQS
jgi:hypothetical protein